MTAGASSRSSAAAPGGELRPRLLRDGVLYTVAVVAPMVSAVAVTPIVTRVLGAGQYGVVALAIGATQVAAVLLALGLPASITRDALIEDEGVEGATGSLVLGVVSALGLAAAVVAGLLVTRPEVAGAPPSAVVLAVASGAALAVLTLCQAQLRARSRVGAFVGLGITAALAAPALGLVALEARGGGAITYLTAMATVQGCVAVAALIIVLSDTPPRFSAAGFRRSLRIGLPTVPHQLAAGGLAGILVLVTGQQSGTTAAGRTQLALLVGTVGIVLVGAFNNSWAPHVYARPEVEQSAYVARTARGVLAGATTLALGTALVGPLVLGLLAPPELATADAARAVAVVAAAAPVTVLYLASIHLVFASGRTSALALTSPTALVLAVSMAVALGALGLAPATGAAVAVVAFHAAQAAWAGWLRRRSGRSPVHVARLVPTVVAGVIVCAALGLIPLSVPVRLGCALAVAATGLLVVRRLLASATRPEVTPPVEGVAA